MIISTHRLFLAQWIIALLFEISLGWTISAVAAPPGSHGSSMEATTSDAARKDAIQTIPIDRLTPEDREKVNAVLSNTSIFRRLPIRVSDCDPDMYLFLVRHPDVVVNIWEVMKASQMQLHQIDDQHFKISESAGTAATFEYLYRNHDTHILYGEGTYSGPLMARPAKGRGLLVLKCGYVRETNGRYYITSRLDCFLAIEPLGVELLTKTVSPLMGKTVDNNFIQTVAFVSSLSRTAEMNSDGIQRLATRLMHVRPEVREQFADIAADVAQKAAANKQRSSTEMARAPAEMIER